MTNGFASELALTVLGGVITSLILEVFRMRWRGGRSQSQTAPAAPRGGGFFAGLIRLFLAVVGGVLIARFGGAYLFQNGLLERSPQMRAALLVGGTMLCWVLLLLFRRR